MSDIASIGIQIETSGIDGAIKRLDTLVQKSASVDKAVDKVGATASKTAKSFADFGRRASRAA